MFQLLFPKVIDNKYRGSWLALVLFVPVMLLKLSMGFHVAGFNPMIDPRNILISADGIPLDSFSAEAVSTIVFFANAWGFSLFVIMLFSLVALLRYRAMLPLAILFVAIEQVGRKAMNIAQDGWRLDDMTTGNIINYVLSALLLLALVLSMSRRKSAAD